MSNKEQHDEERASLGTFSKPLDPCKRLSILDGILRHLGIASLMTRPTPFASPLRDTTLDYVPLVTVSLF